MSELISPFPGQTKIYFRPTEDVCPNDGGCSYILPNDAVYISKFLIQGCLEWLLHSLLYETSLIVVYIRPFVCI